MTCDHSLRPKATATLLHRVSRRCLLRGAGVAVFAAASSAVPIPGLSSSASASSVAGLSGTANYGGGPLAGDNALPSIQQRTMGSDGLQFLSSAVTLPSTDSALAHIRLFGDMHFGFTDPARLAAVANDLAALPPADAFLSPGDETHFGLPAEYDTARAWLAQWRAPFYTVTGNHTFWNAALHRQETSATQYSRFTQAWGQPMPYTWELGGVRFVGAGPIESGVTLTGASMSVSQVNELASVLAAAPQQPTVLVIHSPFRHTVLGDGGPANSVYTSDDYDFFQAHGERLLSVLAAAPQVALVITGHTHSPLHANGLLAQVSVGTRIVPQFNAMALPFVRRDTPKGSRYQQDLVTWDMAIGTTSITLTGRDHLAQRDVARATIPQPASIPSPWSVVQRY